MKISGIFYFAVVMSLCAGTSPAQAETGSLKGQLPKASASTNGTKFYNPNNTKFYNPSEPTRMKFEWPKFEFKMIEFPKFEFPKFFQEGAGSEAAVGRQITAVAKPDSAAQGGDELDTHMNQMSGMLEKVKAILRDYAASQENSGNKKIAQNTKQLSASGEAVSADGDGNLQALLGDLLAAQKDAPKIDPARALEMAYAVQEKADLKRLEVEEEVRRMEEGY